MLIRKATVLLILVAMIAGFVGCSDSGPEKTQKPSILLERFDKSNGLPDSHITTMTVFNNQLWVGTARSGLLSHDGTSWKVRNVNNTNVLGSNIIEVLKVAEGALWIGTDNGVCRYDGHSWASIVTGLRARCVAVRGSEIAIATAHGVDFSRGEPFRSLDRKSANLVNDEVQAVAYDSQGRLWAGTMAGMGLLNGTTFNTYTGPQKTVMGSSLVDIPPSPPNCQLRGNNINVIVPFKGMLAIGTTSGLSITDMGNSWTNFTAPHREWVQRGGRIIEEQVSGNSPLKGNNITAFAVTPDDNGLFVGTNDGIGFYRGNAWVELGEYLPDFNPGRVTSLAVQDDKLWVGTENGLYRLSGTSMLYPPQESK